VTVRACYDEADEKVTQQMDEAVDAAFDVYEDAGADLVNTKPTTLAGIVALCRYIEPLLNDDGELPEVIHWDDETQSSIGGSARECDCRGDRGLDQGSSRKGGAVMATSSNSRSM
jgi:hypothetical protein